MRKAPSLCLPAELARLEVTDVAECPMAALHQLGTAAWPLLLGERRELELQGKLLMPEEAVLKKKVNISITSFTGWTMGRAGKLWLPQRRDESANTFPSEGVWAIGGC